MISLLLSPQFHTLLPVSDTDAGSVDCYPFFGFGSVHGAPGHSYRPKTSADRAAPDVRKAESAVQEAV